MILSSFRSPRFSSPNVSYPHLGKAYRWIQAKWSSGLEGGDCKVYVYHYTLKLTKLGRICAGKMMADNSVSSIYYSRGVVELTSIML